MNEAYDGLSLQFMTYLDVINCKQRSEGIDQSGNVRGCRYCPLKSICRFEANIHMNEHSREIQYLLFAQLHLLILIHHNALILSKC